MPSLLLLPQDIAERMQGAGHNEEDSHRIPAHKVCHSSCLAGC